jgi:hypothetical protein
LKALRKSALTLLSMASLLAISLAPVIVTARADGPNWCSGWQQDAYASYNVAGGQEDTHGWLGSCRPNSYQHYFYSGQDARFGWGGPTDGYLDHERLNMRNWGCGHLDYDQTWERWANDGYGPVPNPTSLNGPYITDYQCSYQADASGIEETYGSFYFSWYKSF